MILQALSAAEPCGLAQFDRGMLIGLALGLLIAAEVYAFAWFERHDRRSGRTP